VLTASDLNIRNPFEVKVRNKSRDQRHARGNLEKKREEKHASKRHGAEFFFFFIHFDLILYFLIAKAPVFS
jgi:hypothetical protein